MAVPYKNGKVNINGGYIAYRLYTRGSKDSIPIVLVAGWGSVMNTWFALPQELAKKGQTVLIFDNRGIGDSAAHTGDISVDTIASDTLALVDALLPNSPSFAVVGHSAGAFVAQHLAICAPDRIAAAVIVGGQGARATAINGAADFFKLGRATFPNDTDLESRMKLLAYFIDTEAIDLVNRRFREICKRSLQEKRPKATINAQLGMLAKADYGKRLKEIHCPVLVMHGDGDTIIPPENAEILLADLSGSSHAAVKRFPGPHVFFGPSIKNAAGPSKAIVEFLSSSSGGAQAKL